MKTKLCLCSVLVLFFSLGIVSPTPVSAKIKIMPLGDSITRGYSSGETDPNYMVSYRKALWDRLTAQSYEVDFVGSENDGSAVFGDVDLADHEGHAGWRDDEIVDGRTGQGKLADWLIAAQPDIVLLHIGTNALDSNPNDVRDILNVIDNYDRSVWVILARIINRNTYSQTTTAFNDAVEALARDRITNPNNPAYPDRIIIVDMEDGAGINYDLVTHNPPGDMWDQVHPFETGYEKMAGTWFSRLQEILPVANAGPSQRVYEGNTVTLDGTKSSDPNGTIVSYSWEQLPGGSRVTLSNPTAAKPTFRAPAVALRREILTFKLTVTDSDGFESAGTTYIVVSDPNSPLSKATPWIPLLLLDD